MDELKELLESFDGKIYDLCYEVLVCSKNQDVAFEFVCKNLFRYPENRKIKIKEYFSEEEIEEYESIYGDTVKGLLNTNIKKCNFGVIDAENFYKDLWEAYCVMFPTEKGKAFAFAYTLQSEVIPYQYLGKPLSMGNEQFKELTEKNKANIDKIRYIRNSQYTQRTERASLLLDCINGIEDYESKVVVLAHALSLLGQSNIELFRDKKDIDALIQQIDKKIEQLEAGESM